MNRTAVMLALAVAMTLGPACHRASEPDAGATSQPTITEGAAAQLSVEPPGAPCGLASPCGTGRYCDYPDDMCGEGADGVCTRIPDVCVQMLREVCGCDGRTWGNGCEAATHGVDARSEGACPVVTDGAE